MNYKLFGSILVIAGCGGTGFSIAAAHMREQKQVSQLLEIIQYMYCELKYHLTPLPQLCRQAGMGTGGGLKNIFLGLAEEMERQNSVDVHGCMSAVLRSHRDISPQTGRLLLRLGKNLGRFDLEGQLKGLEELQVQCRSELQNMGNNWEQRLRSYRTLGICAGTAIAILLF